MKLGVQTECSLLRVFGDKDQRHVSPEVHPLHVMAHRAGTRVPSGVRAETVVKGSEVEADCSGFLSSSRRGACEKMDSGEESNVWRVWWFRRDDGRDRFKRGVQTRATSEGGGKSGVAVAGKIYRKRLGCGPERVSL
ncbi:hypothetical protein DY000_02036294 [Brassica cretica]|uniref:Uncharacterized protein n=1 Tax=Brassica cretica TaxID=69181 RepID=A0ABQ7BE09_BRACR|nr:hypothetical protein DY000_02036294 [Brassica cretica]